MFVVMSTTKTSVDGKPPFIVTSNVHYSGDSGPAEEVYKSTAALLADIGQFQNKHMSVRLELFHDVQRLSMRRELCSRDFPART